MLKNISSIIPFFKSQPVLLSMSWHLHPTLRFQVVVTCWNGFLPSTSLFFLTYIHCLLKKSMQLFATLARSFQLELIVTWCLFMLRLLKTKKSPKLVLNMIFVQFQLQISSQKITPNTTNINLVSDGFCGPVFKDFSDLAVLILDSRFLVSNLHRCLASSLIVF